MNPALLAAMPEGWRRDPNADPDPIPCPTCGRPFAWEWNPDVLRGRVPPHWVPPCTYPDADGRPRACSTCQLNAEMQAHDAEHTRRMTEAGVNRRHLDYTFARMATPKRGEDWQDFAARIKDTKPPVYGVFGNDEHAIQRVRLWRPGDDGFILEGPIGAGKSLLISMLIRDLVRPKPGYWAERSLNRLIEMGHPPKRAKILVETGRHKVWVNPDAGRRFPLFARESDIVQDTMQGWSGDKDPLLRYATADVLIIDDLGVSLASKQASEKQRAQAQLAIARLVDLRYNRQLPTLVTTNLTAEEMRGAFEVDKRTYSRLRELCPQRLQLGSIPKELVDQDVSWRTPGARRAGWSGIR